MAKFNPDKLIKFENKIADLFNSAKIRSPVHLHSGNEKKEIKKILKEDKSYYRTYFIEKL